MSKFKDIAIDQMNKEKTMNIVFDSMVIKKMDSFPANENPFLHDAYNMGIKIGNNVMAIMENHVDEHCNYVDIINIETGERIKIIFGKVESIKFQGEDKVGEQDNVA